MQTFPVLVEFDALFLRNGAGLRPPPDTLLHLLISLYLFLLLYLHLILVLLFLLFLILFLHMILFLCHLLFFPLPPPLPPPLPLSSPLPPPLPLPFFPATSSSFSALSSSSTPYLSNFSFYCSTLPLSLPVTFPSPPPPLSTPFLLSDTFPPLPLPPPPFHRLSHKSFTRWCKRAND